MEKLLENIFVWLKKKFQQQQFVFRFEYYDGTEENKEINDAQVVEYEFINQGNTLCIINDMKVYPPHANIQPDRVKIDIRNNEKDVAIYRYKFAPVDFQVCLIPVVNTNKICSEMVVASPAGCNGQITIINWFLTNPICTFDFVFFINGQPICVQWSQTGSESAATMAGSLIGNLLPSFTGTITAFQQNGNDLVFNFANVVFPALSCGDVGILSVVISVSGGACLAPEAPDTEIVCDICAVNQLLVVAKVIASVKKSN